MKIYFRTGVYLLLIMTFSCRKSINDGLVAYYPFDGDASDHSGHANNGIMEGAVLTADRFDNANSAIRFDGIAANISANVTGMPAVDSPQSFSWWFMIEQPPDYIDSLGADNMIALVDTVKGIGVQAGFRAPGYHTLGLDIWYWGGRTVLESPHPALNKWHHCVYTYDGSIHRFYLDGQESAQSDTKPQTGIPDILMFGNYPSGDQFFEGDLDDIRIYNRVLMQSDINVLYKLRE
jgi:hypothetical protein